MSSAEIIRYASRRSKFIWMPLMSLAVLGVYLTASMPNGLSVLLTMLCGLIALGTVTDWVNAERKALRAEEGF